MTEIILLGAGMVGRAIAYDLSKTVKVLVCDKDQANLDLLSKKKNISTKVLDATNHGELEKAIESFDLVVGALPGSIGFKAAKLILEAGKNLIDISFFPEPHDVLDEIALKKGVYFIPDIGVAPGLSNIMLGYHAVDEEVESFKCYVGGLPLDPKEPFNYKAPFSPSDVIEEYVRPARIRVDGEDVEVPALSEVASFNLEGIEPLESFNSDGLRSLLNSFPEIPNMFEKTLRYPGHAKLMEGFRDSGFFAEEEVEVNGVKVSPLAMTSKLFFKEWELGDEPEFTLLYMEIEALEKTYKYFLYDVRDEETGISSMARTTGFTCSGTVLWCLEKGFNETGCIFPEDLGSMPTYLEYLIEHYAQHGIEIQQSE